MRVVLFGKAEREADGRCEGVGDGIFVDLNEMIDYPGLVPVATVKWGASGT
jgi:hypothetical protein